MVFSSLIFLFAYLPAVLLIYYITPQKGKNLALFLVSLLFYAWGEPVYVLLMLVSLTIAYLFGLVIGECRRESPRRAKFFAALSVCVSISFLFSFKYYNFFAENLSRLPQVTVPTIASLALPIGISFYTFQIISYTVDVYRGDCKAQRNYISFGAYVTLFPQLIAGPIVRYTEIDDQLTARRESVGDFATGVLRFVVGLSKKVLIGDALAAGYRYFCESRAVQPTALGAWLIVILYSLHLYYDFSGYSDMAIGLGRMFGFHFPENFNYPYIAKSITEFWRRWHISLSSWFREYVYIPLGGNRVGTLKRYRNLAVVWMLTGFWHGADWNFVLWGVYFAVVLIVERAFLLKYLEKSPPAIAHLYSLFLIGVGFLIFSHNDLGAAFATFLALFGIGTGGFATPTAIYTFTRLIPLILVAVIGATPLPKRLWERAGERHPRLQAATVILCITLFVVCVAYLVDSTFSPFEYTQF
jgi:alginate O-acetyltransferase complex protein AlgI